MATDIVQSLFGVTPDMYQQQQAQLADARALQFARLTPMEQAQYGISRGAYGLSGALGGAWGAQDPELQRISMRQQIASQLRPNDLSTFDQGIEMMRQAGDGQGALMLQMERDKAQQLALVRQDEALVRQDAAAKRAREAAALQQQLEAQNIARGAYSPGGQEMYGEDIMGQRVGEGLEAPSYDINRVAPQLMALGAAGQGVLLGASKVNEEMAKAQKLAAEAKSAEEKARFAGTAERAAAAKAEADALSAQEKARLAGQAEQAALARAIAEARSAEAKARFAEPAEQAALDKAAAEARAAEEKARLAGPSEQAALDRAIAEAQSAQAKARFAGPVEQAAADKALADALSAQAKAKFAGIVEEAASNRAVAETLSAQAKARFAEPAEQAALDKAVAEARAAEEKARVSASVEQAAADKAVADAERARSEAVSAAAKARVAGPTEQAAADKAVADAIAAAANADKALVEARFAERLQQAGLTEKNWNVKNLQSQISDRAAKLKLDAQTTAANVAEKYANINAKLTELPADTRKLVNESAVLASTSKQAANQMNDLASRIEGLGGYGSFSRLSEFAKSTIGAEGYETSLRQEYGRLRNSAAIKALPPGPATDKDIAMALSEFPKNTSDSKLVAQFLRGMAKMQDIEAAVSNAKTDWLAQNNGTLTRAGKTFVAGDFTVRPGESFNDFTDRVAKDVNAQYAGTGTNARRQALVNQIPTNQPAPAGAPRNVMREADAILRGR
jgi:hypothetical protein